MPRLAHHVFFTLDNASEEKQAELLAACRHYLTDHPGVVDFAIGTRDASLRRPVNDTEYHLSLHVVFANRAAHDAYQAAPRHLDFIEQQKGNWRAVRVFDSLLQD